MTTTRLDPIAEAIVTVLREAPPYLDQTRRPSRARTRAAGSPGDATKTRRARRVQALCGACNHPVSFHSVARTHCLASGCRCQALVDPAPRAWQPPFGVVVVVTAGTPSDVAATVGAITAAWTRKSTQRPTQSR